MTNNEKILTAIVNVFYTITNEHLPTVDVNKIIDEHLELEFHQNDIDRVRETIFENRIPEKINYF